ncbi:hypothetical protein [Bradyrhizobium sp. LHD-71]|uniref:hypothetical protein n=1 Tax=Bradyrhizobium sp. LHD-71 TaxID=3072141 RepID=UPI00280D0149|nr:hypothetical protein [Bradyrhizobium sp. LHD-71]MDQ8732609.1 hypothetical protein [Bradyrhizobium sp. LHD-71]
MNRVTTIARRSKNFIRFRLASRDLHIESPAKRGMFAQLNFCLYMADYTERHGQRLFVYLTGQNYLDPDHGPNWFDYFFFHRHGATAPSNPKTIKVYDNSELPFACRPSLEEANRLFFRHFGIHKDITDHADSFAAAHAIDARTLGVHYRGTDKRTEAEPVKIDEFVLKVERAIAEAPNVRNIVAASDDARFPDALKRRICSLPVISFDDSFRSAGDVPVHLMGYRRGNYTMGRDALINALLLAKCGSIVRTSSFLSAWASIFNPGLTVSLANQPYKGKLWFPEREVLRRATLI